MTLAGLQKVTLIDYPGKIAATVFTSGCSFYCPWCYSAELVLPGKIKNQPKVSEKEFFKFLKSREGLLEAVVVCGGEPSLQRDLEDFIKKIKKMGFLVKLDTNGSAPRILKSLIEKNLLDYVAMDIKAPPEKYDKAVGREDCWNGKILNSVQQSIDILKQGKIDYEFRSTIVPGLHDKEDVVQMAKWISPARRYYLQNFRPEKTLNPEFEKIKPYPKEFLFEIQKIIAPFFETCQVR